MNTALVVAIVLISVGYTYSQEEETANEFIKAVAERRGGKEKPVDCTDLRNDHLKRCSRGGGGGGGGGGRGAHIRGGQSDDKVCVWNKCHCNIARKGCALICSSNPILTCNGLGRGDLCNNDPKRPKTCQKAKLACVDAE